MRNTQFIIFNINLFCDIIFSSHLICSQIICYKSRMSTNNLLNLLSISDENDNASIVETNRQSKTEPNST